MTVEDINNFEKSQTQLEGLHTEISLLARKSQNDLLNKFKLKFVNKAIQEANIILSEEYLPFEEFDQFDEEELPTNSDVAMILGQYLNCMEKLRADNIWNKSVFWYWSCDTDTIRTSQIGRAHV